MQSTDRIWSELRSIPTCLPAANFEGDSQAMSVRAFSEMTFYPAPAWVKVGQESKAGKLLSTVLKRDPNHAIAADLLAELKAA